MTDFVHAEELIPRPKTMKGMDEPMRARALHTMVTNTWMNVNKEQEFCTALESQFCQALRGNNGVTAGQKLLKNEQMDCKGAGVVQTTLWALMTMVSSMAPMASMAPLASVVASMAPMASMVVAPMAPMASMPWIDLMAPELKSEREKVQWFGAHWLHPTLRIKPFVLLLSRCPLGTVLRMSLHPAATPRENDRSRSLRRAVKFGGARAELLPCKIGEERVDGLSHTLVGKSDAGNIEEELVRNELMGSPEKGRCGRRITAPWCGSKVAGWRVAAGETAVLMGVITLLASEASLVSLVRNWNAMVPRLEMVMILRKLDTNVTPVTVVSALTTLLKQLTLKASKAPEDSVTSIAPMATMASMASMVASMASMASVAPMALMALASVALVASMVWVTALKKRKLSNEMLRFSPLKTWLCFSTKQAREADGSRSSRRVDVITVKELMGSLLWSCFFFFFLVEVVELVVELEAP